VQVEPHVPECFSLSQFTLSRALCRALAFAVVCPPPTEQIEHHKSRMTLWETQMKERKEVYLAQCAEKKAFLQHKISEVEANTASSPVSDAVGVGVSLETLETLSCTIPLVISCTHAHASTYIHTHIHTHTHTHTHRHTDTQTHTHTQTHTYTRFPPMMSSLRSLFAFGVLSSSLQLIGSRGTQVYRGRRTRLQRYPESGREEVPRRTGEGEEGTLGSAGA
jgi:hypothetical protein